MSSTHQQTLPNPIHKHQQLPANYQLSSQTNQPSSLVSVIGQPAYGNDVNTESTITLLSRPQLSTTAAVDSNVGPIVPPQSTLDSVGFQSSGLSGSHMNSVTFSGRAARGDYFDTEDPSVNLHDFIINSMQSQKNRVVLVKLEEEFVKYVSDVSRVEPLKLPPWDSYHRMLAHRVSAYFGLEHNVDPMDKMCVVVHKGPNTRLPQRRFTDGMPKGLDEIESNEPKLILKRKEAAEVKLETILGSSSDLSGLKSSFKSFEEREEDYERARARIFSEQSPLDLKEPSTVFDLETPSALTRRKSRFLPAIMQHRRAASDTTAFLFKGGLADLMKEGSASDKTSPSMTPLLSNLNKSTDAIAHSFGSSHDINQTQSTKLSPQTPRKFSQQHEGISQSPPKFSKSFSEFQSSPVFQASEPIAASPPFQSPQGSVPVVYQQPGAMITDPNWYPYQQMMVYQVPQGYVPTPQYNAFGQTILPPAQLYAVNHSYPSVPTGLAPGTVLAPHKDAHTLSDGSGGRGFEQYSSSTHPTGLTLVRPIPQQAAPFRVAAKGAVGPWGSPIHQPYAIQQPVFMQPRPDQSAYIVPYSQDIQTSHLAEQVEASLHISEFSGQSPSKPNKLPDCTNVSHLPSDTMVASSNPADALVGGMAHDVIGEQVVSPTIPRVPVQFIPQQFQPPVYGGAPEGAFVSPGPQGSIMRYPAGFSPQASSPGKPSTPGPLAIPPGVFQARAQGVFSPSNNGMTHSPVQILGHTLGTSLFSPPPSSSSHPALFGQSTTGTGDVPSHPPIGTGAIPESPGLMQSYGGPASNGSQSGALPPRLIMQRQPQKGGTYRYQNQRHPANRGNKLNSLDLSNSNEQMSSGPAPGVRKEALLPTPPSHQMVKLDTNLTCGVPLNVMELISFPPDGSPEILQVMQELKEMGVTDTKSGILPKSGERIMIAIFEDSESAMKALQIKHPNFVLSIPGNNHAKFILSLLS